MHTYTHTYMLAFRNLHIFICVVIHHIITLKTLPSLISLAVSSFFLLPPTHHLLCSHQPIVFIVILHDFPEITTALMPQNLTDTPQLWDSTSGCLWPSDSLFLFPSPIITPTRSHCGPMALLSFPPLYFHLQSFHPRRCLSIFLPSGEVWLLLYAGIWASSLAWAWMSHWYPVLLLQYHNTVLHLLVLFPASTMNFLMTRAFCFTHHPFCDSLPGLPASTL